MEFAIFPINEKYSVPDTACGYLKKAIISHSFSPGSPLSENQIASHPKISRTPIGVVLYYLERDGWVELFQRKGALVSPVAATDVIDVYQIREALGGGLLDWQPDGRQQTTA